MTGTRHNTTSRKRLFPNPFYVVLLVSSTAFVLSALLFYISPFVIERGLQRPAAAPGPGSRALVAWLDRHGPFALAIEFAVMLASAVLAMATDHWFPSRPPRQSPSNSSRS